MELVTHMGCLQVMRDDISEDEVPPLDYAHVSQAACRFV